MSTWQDLVTASLIGTERAVVPPAGPTGVLPGEDGTGDPAAVLLDRAALLTAARRAGRPPDRAEPLPACEPDPRPAMSPAAGRRLARILGGEYPDLLTEWLTAAAARGLRLPPQSLPALLDRARRDRSADRRLARVVVDAGGPRARWLAGLNPDWELAASPTPRALSTLAAAPRAGQDAWRLGDMGQRRGYLASLRASDPDAARDLVAGSWAAASLAERVMFLSVLADRLGPADEPLLEGALDDPAEGVRSWAGSLLSRLPGSALGLRMTARALRHVRLEHGASGPRLVVTPPAECDASMRHDGIAPGPAAGRAQLAHRAFLMRQVVAQTPLRSWTEEFGLTAARVVALRSGDWAPALFTGWAQAAMAQHDHDWMAALVSQALTGRPLSHPVEIEALWKLVRRADPALGTLGALPEPGPDAPPAVRAELGVLRFRYEMLKELDDDHSG